MKVLEQKMMNGQLAWVGKQTVRMHDITSDSRLRCANKQALELISNGVMEDPRVFHFDCNDWMKKYNNQGQLKHHV